MSTIVKSIATIGVVVLVLSFAVVSPQTALGKGNKRTWSAARFQHATNLSSRRLGPSGTRLRTGASGARSSMLLHGDFSSFASNVRRTNPGFIDASNIYGSEGIKAASIRTRTHASRSVTRPFNDGLIVDLKGKRTLNSASGSMGSRQVNLPVRGFKSMSGMDSETEVIARPRSNNR